MASAPMPMQRLGRTGLLVSRLSFGSWVTFSYQLSENPAYELMKQAFAAGVNLFDNAEAYAKGEAERIMGDAVRRGVADGVWAREDLVLTTKLFFGTRAGANNKGLSRKHVLEGAAASVARLGLAYVDVIFAHRPDPVTPIEETVRAFADVIARGLALYWGTSEWPAADVAAAVAAADALGLPRPVAEQPEYNLLCRERVENEYAALLDPAGPVGLGLTTWSPLASGVLTGKYSGRALPPGSRLTVGNYKFLLDEKFGDGAWQLDAADALRPVAAELGCSLAQLALAWCLRNPRVSTVLVGATSAAQLAENLGALAVAPRLTDALMARVAAAAGARSVEPVKLAAVAAQVGELRGVAALANFAGRGPARAALARLDTAPSGRYSEAVVANGTVYLAGQVPEDADADAPAQVASVLAQIDALLARAGSSRRHILSAGVLLRDIADKDALNAAWEAWMPPGCAPARTTAGGAALVDARWRVEITVVAAVAPAEV